MTETTPPDHCPTTLQQDVDLGGLNTLAIPARARYLARVTCVDELQALLQWRRQYECEQQRELPLLILGGGSNLVLSSDFPGLVISMGILGREVLGEDESSVLLRAGGGENWHQWVQYCVESGYFGLENLGLIPGTVGAAPIQNIGAYGVELESCFESLTAVEVSSGRVVTFDGSACRFGYRDSVFKQELRDQFIITSVTLRLHRNPDVRADYPALQQYLSELGAGQPSPQQLFEAVCAIRSSKLPDPAQVPNAGSFFKNPLVSSEQFEQLREEYTDIVGYPQSGGQVKLAAGWLIDRAGWKGHSEDGVGVHDKQALVLVNPGHASGSRLLQLAQRIRDDIRQRFGVELEIEPRVYAY
ncbi:UDP-N-acetylmuramate dehydrogenase [Pseudomaricurvus sp. HS19]|uniref:UDP-N-acetylmuramate dehydrogenase n=1 Tax=Pseudomaricurvus sp. HS19 TaxID=2692626 RepID=UPI00351A8E67